jgi:hypothetical protein
MLGKIDFCSEGHKMDADDVYCALCGNNRQVELCPKCKAPLKVDAKFCTKCREKIPQSKHARTAGDAYTVEDVNERIRLNLNNIDESLKEAKKISRELKKWSEGMRIPLEPINAKCDPETLRRLNEHRISGQGVVSKSSAVRLILEDYLANREKYKSKVVNELNKQVLIDPNNSNNPKATNYEVVGTSIDGDSKFQLTSVAKEQLGVSVSELVRAIVLVALRDRLLDYPTKTKVDFSPQRIHDLFTTHFQESSRIMQDEVPELPFALKRWSKADLGPNAVEGKLVFCMDCRFIRPSSYCLDPAMSNPRAVGSIDTMKNIWIGVVTKVEPSSESMFLVQYFEFNQHLQKIRMVSTKSPYRTSYFHMVDLDKFLMAYSKMAEVEKSAIEAAWLHINKFFDKPAENLNWEWLSNN